MTIIKRNGVRYVIATKRKKRPAIDRNLKSALLAKLKRRPSK